MVWCKWDFPSNSHLLAQQMTSTTAHYAHAVVDEDPKFRTPGPNANQAIAKPNLERDSMCILLSSN